MNYFSSMQNYGVSPIKGGVCPNRVRMYVSIQEECSRMVADEIATEH